MYSNDETRKAAIRQIEARLAVQPDTDDPKALEVRAADESLLSLLKDAETPAPAPAALTEQVELRSYIEAYSHGKRLTGAELELSQEMKMDDVASVPFDVLLPRKTEERAASTITAGSFGQNINEILRAIFKKTDAGALGIDMVGVPAGTAAYPVVTTVPTGAMKAQNADLDPETFSISVETVNPTRATSHVLFPIETAAVYGTEYEDAVRTTLNDVITNLADEQLINGSGTAPAISGILAKLTAPTAAAAVVDWNGFKSAVLDGLDGIYARTESDVNILLGLDTYKKARGLYRTTTAAGNEDGINAMRALGATVNYSARIGKHETGDKNQYAIRHADPMGVVMPVWVNGLQLVRDPYSASASGQVRMVAHLLFNVGYRRTTAWKQIDFKLVT